MPADPATIELLSGTLGLSETSEFRGRTRFEVPSDRLFEVLRILADDRGFDLLVDVTCVDYLNARHEVPGRFGLVYLLANTTSAERLTIRCYLDEPDLTVPSVVPIWKGAEWLEREVYDLFGITFEGHPDLRRIVLPQEFAGHPLRKDYPLQGRGERHNFPVITRSQS